MNKKKPAYKSVEISYKDLEGTIKNLGGKYTFHDSLPNLEFNGSSLILDFDYQKSKRHHITCTMCQNSNSPDEYCFICSVCFNRYVDIVGDFKVIGADKESL